MNRATTHGTDPWTRTPDQKFVCCFKSIRTHPSRSCTSDSESIVAGFITFWDIRCGLAENFGRSTVDKLPSCEDHPPALISAAHNDYRIGLPVTSSLARGWGRRGRCVLHSELRTRQRWTLQRDFLLCTMSECELRVEIEVSFLFVLCSDSGTDLMLPSAQATARSGACAPCRQWTLW